MKTNFPSRPARTASTLRALILTLLTTAFFYALCTTSVEAQGRFQLRRTKSEGVPIKASILAGYNGMNDPSNLIQDAFDHTVLTSAGGVMIGLQGMIRIDTTLLPVWVGTEAYYHRIAKRWTMDKAEVRFPDEEGRVDAVETMGAYGGHVIIMLGPVANLSLILGGGMQYLNATLDKDVAVLGLFGSHWVPTALAGIDINLLTYEHGSIDLQLRGMKGFKEYGSFQVQSLLAFTFEFN